jgi:hypothetical protein
MASELLSSLSPDEVALRLRNERVERDFGPPSAPRPMIQRDNQIPEASSPSRCSDDTSLPVGMLLYLASVAVGFARNGNATLGCRRCPPVGLAPWPTSDSR